MTRKSTLNLLIAEALLSTLSVMVLRQVPYEAVHHIIATIPVYTVLLPVIFAILSQRVVDRLLARAMKPKKVVLLCLPGAVAIFPWQLIVRFTCEPVRWDQHPRNVRREMSLQQTVRGESGTRAEDGTVSGPPQP